MRKDNAGWRFAVDRGGTFTDVVGRDPGGILHTLKLLSSSASYEDASIEGVRRMLGLGPDAPLPEDKIDGIRFGTTVATNALLERKGGGLALLVTKGFHDLLEIGYQNRPDIFRLCVRKPPPLYSTVIEVDERVGCDGGVVRDLDIHLLSGAIARLADSGVDALAVVLMHSWINPVHELLCEELLRKHGFSNVFLSHRAANLIKIVSRGQSTLVDACLSTVLARYLDGIKAATGGIHVEFMQSNGVLSRPSSFMGKNAVLSGPAGGVIAVAETARQLRIGGVIGFDMGGTSTDISRFDGELDRIYEQVIAGIPLQAEMLNIITVAAGGGSILNFDGRRMTAGPESAGSDPGPACYGFGGPLTVTDANLFTGRIVPGYFPKTFGPERNSSLDAGLVKEKFLILTGRINEAMGTDFTPWDVACGFLRVADEKMAMAIKEISVSRGFDIRDYALVCFGGAGGQHACSIASLLDIDSVIIHPLGSVMSAYGIGLSKPAWKNAVTMLRPYNSEVHNGLSVIFDELEKKLLPERRRSDHEIITKREVDIRPEGAETFLTLEYGSFDGTILSFHEHYRRLFGISPEDRPLELVNVRVEVRETTEFFIPCPEKIKPDNIIHAQATYQEIYYSKGPVRSPLYLRESLPPSAVIKGPAFIVDRNSTVVIDPGFEAEMHQSGIIFVKRLEGKKNEAAVSSDRPDPVLLEVFNNLFMGIAAEMGLVLQKTAYSVNMKERLDFSCAVFDPDGNLVANAPHIPVHLGSMADTVKAVLEDNRNTMKQGDVYLTNNPYRGGSHLPDMTVVCPVFSGRGEIIFFTAARGHHSDVGGITPGSMPPVASHISEEGILIENFLLVRDGTFRENELRSLLSGSRNPARNIEERIYDFRAQIASCHKGVKELRHVISKYGLDMVRAYMRYIQENSAYAVRKALSRFIGDSGSFYSSFEDHMDDGTPIKAAITIDGGDDPPETVKAVIDFTGTGEQHMTDNLNAPLSITRSAVIYVLRSLIDTDVPLNSGCLRPVDIIIPPGTVLNPDYPAPVASGNVETSQRIVDVLLGAFGIAAASQGTMNNLLFEVEGGNIYYETIAGGSGGMDGCAGASGVQVHMTNTRMTDPEILEFRHPGVRIERFTLRRGSGGRGKFPGGDGVVREIKFLKPATVSVITERRLYAPY
ncbi:MAG: hydantoinase B/oxoprolinase family protein, partial [Nitrospirota bacterium]|nr:hydantoinase B/oxoprolinase family protein [Nitrospirota bacterium]